MANILDQVIMAEQVASPSGSGTNRKLPSLAAVRRAVRDFLEEMPNVRAMAVTKIALIEPEKGTWEAEADVHVPNATVAALGLPLQKEVLDCQAYLLRLDGDLNIVAYGSRDGLRDSEES